VTRGSKPYSIARSGSEGPEQAVVRDGLYSGVNYVFMRTAARFEPDASVLLIVIAFHIISAAQPHSWSAAELDRLIQDKNYPRLEQELPSANLDSADRIYFEAVLADRNNRTGPAIAGWKKILPQLRTRDVKRAAIALRALADDYFKVGRYGDASDTCSDLLKHFASQLSAVEKQTITDNRNIFELLRGAPPQTISGEREFTLPLRRDGIGDLDVPVRIGQTTEWWIFDTGANQSTITMSSARRLGLAISKGTAGTASGATGRQVSLRVAVIPEMVLGKAIVRNAVALVMNDKDLDVNLGENGHYQIQGVLGYPVLAALGSWTLSPHAVQIKPESHPSSRSARLYVEELTPLLAANIDGEDLLFGLDTGSDGAILSRKYLREFPQQFASLKAGKEEVGGAGGLREISVYRLPQVELHLGSATATLKNVSVLSEEIGADPMDGLFGNLGQALLKQFRTYTIDFTGMRFVAGENAN
jgi:predicted aspartyl protease